MCWNLRDLVASWCEQGQLTVKGQEDADALAVVYPDNIATALLRSFESLAVVASESMQHQTLAAVYRALALALRCVPQPLKAEVHGVVLRSLAELGDQVLTADLDEAITQLGEALDAYGLDSTALRSARGELARSEGRLNSRATRVPTAKTLELVELLRVASRFFRIMRRRHAQRLLLVIGELPNRARGRADDQAAGRERLAFGDQRAGADDAFASRSPRR